MKYIFLSFFLFISSTIFSQISIDTLYTKKIQESPFSTFGYSILELDDNSLLLSAAINGNHSYCDLIPMLYKTNQDGNNLSSDFNTFGQGKIIKTIDNNFVNIRNKYRYQNCSKDTILISKFDINSNPIWSKKRYFGICNNQVSDIIQTNDSGYIVTGFFSTTNCEWPFYNSFLLKLDEFGTEEWLKYFGNSNNMEEIKSVKQTDDNGFVLLSYSPYNKFNIIKTNSLGNVEWTTSIIGNSSVSGGDLELLSNNEIMVTGNRDSETFLIKINEFGTILNEYNYSNSILDAIGSFPNILRYLEDIDSYLFVIGSKIFIINNQGEIIANSQDFNEAPYFYTSFSDLIKTSNGELVAVGRSDGQLILVKFLNPNVSSVSTEDLFPEIIIYPNPTEDYVMINSIKLVGKVKIEVVNYLGQTVYRNDFDANKLIKIPIEGSSGLYVIRINDLHSYKIIKN